MSEQSSRSGRRLKFVFSLTLLATICRGAAAPTTGGGTTSLPVPATVDRSLAAQGSAAATHSVLRIICGQQGTFGTGFLHRSGFVISANHVVNGCPQPILLLSNGAQIGATVIATDSDHDLALIKPATPIKAPGFPISARSYFAIGSRVATWGFPAGYSGLLPLMTFGYLSGVDGQPTPSGKIARLWVVNAAFNSGNSGGPLVESKNGEVIGVVSRKLAPVSLQTLQILNALEQQNSGFLYTVTMPDGSNETLTEGQLIGKALNDLRGQVQLVIGEAVTVDDLRTFLKDQKITP